MKEDNSANLELFPEDDSSNEVLVEYDITSYPSDLSLRSLKEMWDRKDIVIPDFQREFVWKIKQSTLLIESFLVGLPVPPIFLYIDDDNKSLVIDGQQRLLSVIYFFEEYFGIENSKGKRQIFRLSSLNERSPYYNKRFSDLEPKDRRKLEGSVLRAINIRQLSPKEESTSVYHIFERLNTGGTPLAPQEIRNCVFRGGFLNSLRKLNTDKNWRAILSKTPIDKHQKDVELILRVYGLSYHLDSYEKPMKEFLNKVANKYKNPSPSIIEKFSEDFKNTCKIINEQLRKKPFNVRGPLNTSVFDSVFCVILKNLNTLPSNLHNRYEDLIVDPIFVDYTTLATTDEKIVKARFKYVNDKLIK
ncbi:DUF262 domain-containing protein [Mucilaginibacter sp.]|uniref:DUF262 domain-containing protein n=1 Tax=Mucilaginibacter sp. TaxID=1882438 RepID=UPI002634E3B0|nr:DUF262 domain-containing protein [Mucilaginibacter sp.]MDB4924456.1 hypothetical protein [Mucilaginibacter sp.]